MKRVLETSEKMYAAPLSGLKASRQKTRGGRSYLFESLVKIPAVLWWRPIEDTLKLAYNPFFYINKIKKSRMTIQYTYTVKRLTSVVVNTTVCLTSHLFLAGQRRLERVKLTLQLLDLRERSIEPRDNALSELLQLLLKDTCALIVGFDQAIGLKI